LASSKVNARGFCSVVLLQRWTARQHAVFPSPLPQNCTVDAGTSKGRTFLVPLGNVRFWRRRRAGTVRRSTPNRWPRPTALASSLASSARRLHHRFASQRRPRTYEPCMGVIAWSPLPPQLSLISPIRLTPILRKTSCKRARSPFWCVSGSLW